MNGLNLRAVIRAVAGAYVVYLGISLINTFRDGESPAWTVAAGIGFIAAGGALVVLFLRDLIRGQRMDREEYEEKKQKELEEKRKREQASEVKMTDITKYTSVTEEDEE